MGEGQDTLTIGLHRADGRVCVRPSHYEAQALAEITHLTADARLHDDGDGVDCVLHPKRYRTIVVDPPWPYNDKMQSGNSGFGGKTRLRRGAANHYPLLAISNIGDVLVPDYYEDDAHLYLWATNAFMVEAHTMAVAWGFKPKTILTWVKPQIGMGHYFRNNTEHVIFAVRGTLPTLRRDQPTAFTAPRGRHSEKPAAFYDMVESMSPGPYLDVFARKHRFNWDVYGNEVYSDIPLVGTDAEGAE